MSHKVVALVYPTQNNKPVTDSSNEAKRALRGLRSSLSAAYGGRATYTSWGDARGQDAAGNPVLAYAVTMEVQKDEKAWFLETFWGADETCFREIIPGVGYFERAAGRASMFALDIDDLDEGVKAIVKAFGIDYTAPGKATRVPGTAPTSDPYGSVVELLALCNESVEGFNVVANLGTSRAALVEMYEASLNVSADDEAPNQEPDIDEDRDDCDGDPGQSDTDEP